MITELGHFALILALCVAVIQATVPLAGAARQHAGWMAVGRSCALMEFALIVIAMLALMHAYVTSDFTVTSEAFANKVAELDIKQITFHGLRHTHITHLLKSGVPVHVVSARAGHAKASTTLDTYSHLLGDEDAGAANKAEEMLQRVLK